ncbi:unnamed protein product [Acanthoscelides obtectus]|uniref:Uncharacterized protein n=1 Tax=Acanthoscelides obtectus TaxID=200917 RepID=A0A9P0LXD4_ACAOB|nr:unnamed protein product [Acanthoscelides obtectus]CAK1672550.1 hypothetical protein AOBTE_LOCUS28959 [Acanthoscelides obtectus]
MNSNTSSTCNWNIRKQLWTICTTSKNRKSTIRWRGWTTSSSPRRCSWMNSTPLKMPRWLPTLPTQLSCAIMNTHTAMDTVTPHCTATDTLMRPCTAMDTLTPQCTDMNILTLDCTAMVALTLHCTAMDILTPPLLDGDHTLPQILSIHGPFIMNVLSVTTIFINL